MIRGQRGIRQLSTLTFSSSPLQRLASFNPLSSFFVSVFSVRNSHRTRLLFAMRSSRVNLIRALFAAIALVSVVSAHEGLKIETIEDEDKPSSSVAESSPAKSVELPTFTPSTLKGVFIEQFTPDWADRWSASHATKQTEAGKEQFSYVGEWAVEEPVVFKGMIGDKGLVVKNAAAHHAISAPFEVPLDNTGKTLVVQYEVKLQNGLECGGAYLKLLTESPDGIQAQEFSDKTPYTIMFGPDKCGSTNKVHFIFRHKNPITGEYEEKHLTAAPTARISKLSNLYTLIVRPDQTYEVKINNDAVKSGSLLEDFSPPVNPPEEIDDPSDVKPADWVDTARIPDPDAVKPDDWDEDAPREIPDTDAEKPSDWLDDEPELIPDPEATKPEDWDDEEDGDWVAPTILNPKCNDASGCGEWVRPMMRNPDYKGKWSAPMIDNPEYKGVWKPRKIANPNYFKDSSPSKFEKMGAIGFELWTMQNNIMFDNIYIGHSESEAAKFAKETWGIKYPVEKALEDAEKPKISDDIFDGTWKDDPVKFVTQLVTKFIDLARIDVLSAFKAMPGTGGGLVVGVVTVIAMLGGLISLLLAPSKPKATPKKTATAEKEDASTVEGEKDEIVVEDAPPADAPRKRATRKAE